MPEDSWAGPDAPKVPAPVDGCHGDFPPETTHQTKRDGRVLMNFSLRERERSVSQLSRYTITAASPDGYRRRRRRDEAAPPPGDQSHPSGCRVGEERAPTTEEGKAD